MEHIVAHFIVTECHGKKREKEAENMRDIEKERKKTKDKYE